MSNLLQDSFFLVGNLPDQVMFHDSSWCLMMVHDAAGASVAAAAAANDDVLVLVVLHSERQQDLRPDQPGRQWELQVWDCAFVFVETGDDPFEMYCWVPEVLMIFMSLSRIGTLPILSFTYSMATNKPWSFHGFPTILAIIHLWVDPTSRPAGHGLLNTFFTRFWVGLGPWFYRSQTRREIIDGKSPTIYGKLQWCGRWISH